MRLVVGRLVGCFAATLLLTNCAGRGDYVSVSKADVASRSIFPSSECDLLIRTICIIRPSPDHSITVSEVRRGLHGSFKSVVFQKDEAADQSALMLATQPLSKTRSAESCNKIDQVLCPAALASHDVSIRNSYDKAVGNGSDYHVTHIDVIQSTSQLSPDFLSKNTIYQCYYTRGGAGLWCGSRLPDCKVDAKGGWCDIDFKLAS